MNKKNLVGKKIAEKAFDFNTVDAGGKAVSLSGYQGKLNVFLVFNRGFT